MQDAIFVSKNIFSPVQVDSQLLVLLLWGICVATTLDQDPGMQLIFLLKNIYYDVF